MNLFPWKMSTFGLSLLAGVGVVCFSNGVEAASIGFHNHLKKNIYVEAVSIVRNKVLRDRPLLINPGKVGWHMNVPPGNRVIYIYDANPPVRLLYRNAIGVGAQNLFFAVQPAQPVRGAPRATLVPAKPPKGAMGR
jgi:hypothetical protein